MPPPGCPARSLLFLVSLPRRFFLHFRRYICILSMLIQDARPFQNTCPFFSLLIIFDSFKYCLMWSIQTHEFVLFKISIHMFSIFFYIFEIIFFQSQMVNIAWLPNWCYLPKQHCKSNTVVDILQSLWLILCFSSRFLTLNCKLIDFYSLINQMLLL